MKEYTTNTEIVKVLSSKIRMADYQRPLDQSRVKKIVREFKPDLVNYIKCSKRTNGDVFAFDGQHTIAALERLNGGLPVVVECRVYEFVGLDDTERYETEAILFAQQNGISRQVSLGNKLRAEFLAGQPSAVSFYNSCNIFDLEMDFTKHTGVGKITCLSEAYTAWKVLGESRYRVMLGIVVNAWDKEPDSLRREIIGGMAIFIKMYDGQFDTHWLTQRLSKISPLQIIRDGNLVKDSGKGKYAQQILKIYNRGNKRKLM